MLIRFEFRLGIKFADADATRYLRILPLVFSGDHTTLVVSVSQ